MLKRSRCGAVRVYYSRNGLWKLSRGARACFRNRAVVRFAPGPRQLQLKQAVECGGTPGGSDRKIRTLKRRRLVRGAAQLRLRILRADASAERLAERNLHRATCTEQLEDRCRATCVQQLAERVARSSLEQCSLRRHFNVKRCLRGWRAWGIILSFLPFSLSFIYLSICA